MADVNGVTPLVNDDKKSTKFEKQRQSWEKIRKRGQLSFILYRGVLGWGGLMFLVMTATKVFVDHRRLSWFSMLVSALVWALAGYCWGLCVWSWTERRFQGAGKQQNSIKESKPS